MRRPTDNGNAINDRQLRVEDMTEKKDAEIQALLAAGFHSLLAREPIQCRVGYRRREKRECVEVILSVEDNTDDVYDALSRTEDEAYRVFPDLDFDIRVRVHQGRGACVPSGYQEILKGEKPPTLVITETEVPTPSPEDEKWAARYELEEEAPERAYNAVDKGEDGI